MTFWFGADYNPEQWPEEVWADDIRLMREAGVTVMTVGVFSWGLLERSNGSFDFTWLDRILDLLHDGGIGVDLATSTASPPQWLTTEHPEVLLVDEWGHTLSPGSRQHYNPSSATYRRYACRLVAKLAERYGSHPALVAWHVGNEYGNDNPRDYSDETAAAFRDWLARKYGSIDAVNKRWGTAFWSQNYTGFDEILPPRAAPTFRNPSQSLDFDRFSSDTLLDCYRAEAAIVRAASPHLPVTTNFMGLFKPADYWAWAKEVDFVSDDAYPDPAVMDSWKDAALQRDLMRSLGGGKPWMLMEQATSAVNWRALNAPKLPGQMRALSYQAVARGADGILYFQWRQARRGGEKFHSGMVPHGGTDSRIWRDVVQLGRELHRLRDLAGTHTAPAGVAIMVDWDSWWSIEQDATPARIDYKAVVSSWHSALLDLGITVDFAGRHSDLSEYGLVVVPALFVTGGAMEEALTAYAEAGGTLLVTALTGTTDEDAALTPGGYLGTLAATLGVRIEEFAPHPSEEAVRLVGEIEAETVQWAEVVHAHDALVVSRFAGGLADGGAALTRRNARAGIAWYLAADLTPDGTRALLRRVLGETGITPEVAGLPADIEAVRRGRWTIVVSHRREPVTVPVAGFDVLSGVTVRTPVLVPFGVLVLER
ncbi:beta-galactosidase [Herbiconiux sp. CPCC 205763]|uniref:Beta-galactosidase n=1 Tax=Herbiconiux aconitum TaxID=2970913 RepID=A0ABT2GN16_9MICO|nr:beta-galactosidase [Herbiconiux aconitum]MCS5717620.1 beta-galactosidase [Herbiconiux aconitum]